MELGSTILLWGVIIRLNLQWKGDFEKNSKGSPMLERTKFEDITTSVISTSVYKTKRTKVLVPSILNEYGNFSHWVNWTEFGYRTPLFWSFRSPKSTKGIGTTKETVCCHCKVHHLRGNPTHVHISLCLVSEVTGVLSVYYTYFLFVYGNVR